VFDPFPVLSTARLQLREVRASDATAHFVIRSDAAVARFIRAGPDTELATTEARIERIREGMRAGATIHWALESRATGAFLGTAGFWRWDKQHFRAELGYDLAPVHWGEGYMVEALTPIIAYGFETMKLHSMEGNIDLENRQSARVLEKLGFVREALFRESVFKDGKFHDTAVYSLLHSASREAGTVPHVTVSRGDDPRP
jgi:[ribosomal protein S5]-alanine N-acetyltransferase